MKGLEELSHLQHLVHSASQWHDPYGALLPDGLHSNIGTWRVSSSHLPAGRCPNDASCVVGDGDHPLAKLAHGTSMCAQEAAAGYKGLVYLARELESCSCILEHKLGLRQHPFNVILAPCQHLWAFPLFIWDKSQPMVHTLIPAVQHRESNHASPSEYAP
jgi:hypothetical protein